MPSRGIIAQLGAALVVGVVAWLAYARVQLPPMYNGGDNLWTVPTALSMVREGNLDLSEYADAVAQHPPWEVWINDLERDPRIFKLKDRKLIWHPVGGALAAAPFAALYNSVGVRPTDPIREAMDLTREIAHIVSAAAVSLLLLLLLQLRVRAGRALAITAMFAFATPHFVTHADGLWSHSIFLPFLLTSLLLLTARDGRYAGWAGITVAVGYVVRPDSFTFIPIMAAYIWIRHRRQLPLFIATGGCVALAFVLFSMRVYGHWLPPYYLLGGALHLSNLLAAVPGHLFSPNRGILVFAPVVLFSFWGLLLVWRGAREDHALFRLITLLTGVHFLMISLVPWWWAGHSYGPRYFCTVLPLYALMLAPAIDAIARMRTIPRSVLTALLIVACGWGLFANIRGISDPRVHEWNALPVDIDRHPERAWDWGDMQMLRGWSAGDKMADRPLDPIHD